MFPSLGALPKHPLVDTGILFDIVLWQALRNEKRAVLPAERDAAVVVEYFQACRPATTSQVLAEVDGHLKSRKKREQLKNARRRSFTILKNALDDELPVRLSSLDIDVIADFGPTDAGLVNAAAAHGFTLFTSDAALDAFARARGVSVLSIWQLLSHPELGRRDA
jgi:rRNA-processing protein FCF1